MEYVAEDEFEESEVSDMEVESPLSLSPSPSSHCCLAQDLVREGEEVSEEEEEEEEEPRKTPRIEIEYETELQPPTKLKLS